jgi:folate-dependent phosphoribosylglycinamide formyltransferase PurN
MKRIVILISGRGSNMEAVVRACDAQAWPASVVAVISMVWATRLIIANRMTNAQISQLSSLEQEVLLARYSENAPSVARLAERMGRSRHQIQAIEKRALNRLRQVIEPMLNP